MRIKIIMAFAVATGASATANAAFTVTYEAAGVQNSTADFAYSGVETFNARALGSSQSFTSSFGANGKISGAYSGVNILAADQFGGAGGTGRYAQTSSAAGYSINLTSTDARGVNYFGYWLSALDRGNQVTFYKGGEQVFSFSPTDVDALVGSGGAYYGNPNAAYAGQNKAESYVFLNFFSDSTFDKVVLTETLSGAGYESDNHTVGYYTRQSGTQVGAVPEPASWAMMIGGFGMVGSALRRNRARGRAAAA